MNWRTAHRTDRRAEVTVLGAIGATLVASLLWSTCGYPVGAALAATKEIAAKAAPDAAPLGGIQVTATRKTAAIQDVAPAVTSVDESEIRRRSPQVLGQILRGEIGTFFQQTTPGQGIPIIRGLKGSQLLYLIDGMRLNNAFFRSAPNQYLALVDPYNTKRIEAVRGPASGLYGAEAMGGVLQVLTPERDFGRERWEGEGHVYATLGSADLSQILRLEGSAARNSVALLGGITYQGYGNRRIGGGPRVGPSDYKSRAADLKLLFAPTSADELMFNVQYLEQPDTPRFDELVPGFGQTEPSSEQFFFRPNRRDFFHARYRRSSTWSFADDMEIDLARQVITDDRLTQETGSTIEVRESNDSTLDGLTIQFGKTVGETSNLRYGLEIYSDTVRSGRTQTDLTNGQTQAVPARFPDNSTLDSLAVYVYDEWRLGSAWTLSGGLRYSRFDIELPATTQGNGANLEPDDLTGNFSALFEVTPMLNLVANIGRGFRPPNVFDLGTLGARPGNRFNVANPDLEPESVLTTDLGFKLASDRWQAEMFVFYSDYDDKIVSVATGDTTPDGRIVVRSENVNEVTIYGLESGARYFTSRSAEIYGVLNYTRGEERFGDGTRQPADRIPPLNGRLGVRSRLAPRLDLDAYALFAKEQDRLSNRDIADPRIDPAGTPGWTILNLEFEWQVRDRLQLGVNLYNLFDKRYREHGSGIDAQGFNAKFILYGTL